MQQGQDHKAYHLVYTGSKGLQGGRLARLSLPYTSDEGQSRGSFWVGRSPIATGLIFCQGLRWLCSDRIDLPFAHTNLMDSKGFLYDERGHWSGPNDLWPMFQIR